MIRPKPLVEKKLKHSRHCYWAKPQGDGKFRCRCVAYDGQQTYTWHEPCRHPSKCPHFADRRDPAQLEWAARTDTIVAVVKGLTPDKWMLDHERCNIHFDESRVLNWVRNVILRDIGGGK